MAFTPFPEEEHIMSRTLRMIPLMLLGTVAACLDDPACGTMQGGYEDRAK